MSHRDWLLEYRAEPESRRCWTEMASGLQDHVATHLMDKAITPALAQMPDERRTGQVSRKLHASGQGEALVTNQMQSYAGRQLFRSIEKISAHSFVGRFPQFLPKIALRDNRLREALGDKAAVGLLGNLENQTVHCQDLSPLTSDPQQSVALQSFRVRGRGGDQTTRDNLAKDQRG